MKEKDTSDLVFDQGLLTQFFSQYPSQGTLEEAKAIAFSDTYTCLNQYDLLWQYRYFKQRCFEEGQGKHWRSDNISTIVVNFMAQYLDSCPELIKRLPEIEEMFTTCIPMKDSELADYAIELLDGVITEFPNESN